MILGWLGTGPLSLRGGCFEPLFSDGIPARKGNGGCSFGRAEAQNTPTKYAMKFLRIEKSLTSAENVVLTIVNRREGATLLSADECHSIEVRASDLRGLIGVEVPGHLSVVDEMALSALEHTAEDQIAREEYPVEDRITPGTVQGL